MKVQVRLFAVLRERAGSNELELELPEGATVADALAALDASGPLAGLIARLPVQMAVNRDYANGQTPLRESDELALIPPVSGGSEPPTRGTAEAAADARVRRARISTEPLSIERLSELVASPAVGALVIFSGMTREVPRLDYEAYAEMAEPQLRVIAGECAARHSLEAIAIEHRIGSVALGESSVLVAASAGHRAEAFAGAHAAIDLIKERAPIWKREITGPQAEDGAAGGLSAGSTPLQQPASAQQLTHLDTAGRASMVDVSAKAVTSRRARAVAAVRMSVSAAAQVAAGDAPKGEVLATARLAGIQAAKQAGLLIPLAHPLTLTHIAVEAQVDVAQGLVAIESEVRTEGRTGVEIEAMTACAVAALTVYDMVKGIEKGVVIEQVLLLEKSGGRSDWRRSDSADGSKP